MKGFVTSRRERPELRDSKVPPIYRKVTKEKGFPRKMNYREDLAKDSPWVCNRMCTWSN